MMLLAYTIPNIYMFFRLWSLFVIKKYRTAYILAYLAIAAIYPLADIVGNTALRHCLDNISLYLLPYLLYMFMLTLVCDIFLGLRALTMLAAKCRPATNPIKRYGLPVIALSAAVIVAAGAINFNTVRTTQYTIDIPAHESPAGKLRIAFAADFHIDTRTPEKFIQKFADEVNSHQPDLVLFVGDIVEGRSAAQLKNRTDILSQITSTYGSYGVLGNHEHYRNQEDGAFFANAGITLLRDTVIPIGNAFYLAGRNEPEGGRRKTPQQLLQTATRQLPVIMMAHRPIEFNEVTATKTDVHLSGHTHRGQMFPLNLIIRNMYPLSYGYRKIENVHFFVTSGIRLWNYPVRTAGKSEIMIIDINLVK
jgi:predicted MPP superfamily phosphohydrolase